MDEAALVQAAQAGDRDAFAQLFAAHFDSVYDFAARLTGDRDAAANVADEAFGAVMTDLPGLRTGAGFRARLFAVARTAALRDLELTPPASFGPGGEAAAGVGSLASLVREGSLGLDPGQLSLLDLNLRQGLDGGEIAAVLGTSTASALVVLARLEHVAEEFLAAFVMSRRPGADCPRLTAALATVDTTVPSPELRRVVRRHLLLCPRCQESRSRLASPLAAFAALPALEPPAGIRERILDRLLRRWPGAATTRPQRASADRTAGTLPLSLPAGSGWPARTRVLAVAGLGTVAALLAGALFVPSSPFALGGFRGDDEPSSVADGAAPLPSATRTPTPNRTAATATAPRAASPSGATIAAGSATPTAATGTSVADRTATATSPPASPTPAVTLVPESTPTPTPAPTPTAAPCVPRLATNGISQLFLALGGSGSFFVYDAGLCGPLALATSASSWLAVAPATGSFGTGGMAEVTVTAPGSGLVEGPHRGEVTVAGVPNGGQVIVAVTVTVVGNPPEVLSASCTAAGGSWSFAARAKDDYAVSWVALKDATETGNVTVRMDGPNGSPSGDWTASIAADAKAHKLTVTAFDAAGQIGSLAVAGCS